MVFMTLKPQHSLEAQLHYYVLEFNLQNRFHCSPKSRVNLLHSLVILISQTLPVEKKSFNFPTPKKSIILLFVFMT